MQSLCGLEHKVCKSGLSSTFYPTITTLTRAAFRDKKSMFPGAAQSWVQGSVRHQTVILSLRSKHTGCKGAAEQVFLSASAGSHHRPLAHTLRRQPRTRWRGQQKWGPQREHLLIPPNQRLIVGNCSQELR